jgi:hypothetical protein
MSHRSKLLAAFATFTFFYVVAAKVDFGDVWTPKELAQRQD